MSTISNYKPFIHSCTVITNTISLLFNHACFKMNTQVVKWQASHLLITVHYCKSKFLTKFMKTSSNLIHHVKLNLHCQTMTIAIIKLQ